MENVITHTHDGHDYRFRLSNDQLERSTGGVWSPVEISTADEDAPQREYCEAIETALRATARPHETRDTSDQYPGLGAPAVGAGLLRAAQDAGRLMVVHVE